MTEAELNRMVAWYGTGVGTIPGLLAEVLRLRAGLEGLRREHVSAEDGDGWGLCETECQCGADEQNARIDALLAGEDVAA